VIKSAKMKVTPDCSGVSESGRERAEKSQANVLKTKGQCRLSVNTHSQDC
jgi:hypothetical protein